MKLYYDLHIHSALSPCSDDDMTPNNIVNMALLKGLDVIAVTDHNSCKNLPAIMNLAKQNDLLVVPGMELQTKEEVHVLCLFTTLEDAIKFQDIVYKRLPNMKNNPELFGNQLIFNEEDEVEGTEDIMLLNSADIDFDEAFKLVNELKGAFIPCHIDKDTFSVISNLGFVPEYLKINTVEVANANKYEKYIAAGIIRKKYKVIKNSDSHFLGKISERENFIYVKSKTIEAVLEELR
ncbi:DNA polymerase III PolC-type [Caloramator mitchellensis]|uniref:DNA polymerase III PolC-type n=1 Tax=Caloramator mitchellensis TaxID=908809 RepID=A0A0R3JX00_CALMK|nr:PHP domain-containing protein [Caloramator mitchellensis]KRQ88096.1 DNA polymerase III PolC-type [Caloramator mitchellensis]